MTQLATATPSASLASLAPTVMRATQLATIPVEDHTDFLSLSLAERQEITLQLEVFSQLEIAPSGRLQRVCKDIAKSIRTTYPHLRGYSAVRIYKKFILWRDGGQKTNAHGKPIGTYYAPHDWRCLVKEYNNGKDKGLPPEFVEHIVSEWAKTTRDKDAFNALRGRLKQDWLKGKDIPGFGTADEWYPKHGKVRPTGKFLRDADCPRGWSYSNLKRTLKRALPRQSMQRAAQGQANRLGTPWGALLKRDRSQLRFMEMWTPDDARLDLQCRMYIDGKWQIVYVDALFALDVATGTIIGWGIKPRATRNEDTELGRKAGTKMSVNARDMLALLASVVRNGLPPYTCTMLHEMATAKLSDADEAGALALLGELGFAVEGTGQGRGQLLKSGFAEQWGRPAVKQWIESFFRVLHTWLNNVPGTVGRRYESTRGDHKERVKYTVDMLARAEKLVDGPLSPEHPLHEQLRLPILTIDEVNGIVAEIVDALNWRIDHKLQGFDRIFEFQLPDGRWLPEVELNKLAPDDRAGVQLTPRRESPAERAGRLIAPYAETWQHLAPEVITTLLADKRLVTAKGGRISFKDERLSVDSLDYVADKLHTLDKYEGAKDALLAYLADDLSHAVLTDAKTGAVITTAQREGRVCLRDKAALARRMGEVNREMQDELSHVRTFLGSHEREYAAMRDNNDAALAAAAVTAAADRASVPEVAQVVTSERRSALSRKPVAADIRKQQDRFARQAALARAAADTL